MNETKQKILDYAIDTIQTKGMKTLTLEAITKNCHISRSTFYQYFTSKKALIEEIRALHTDLNTNTTKEEILLAANKAFSKHPYQDINLETIAEAVDMKRSSIYRYFPTKDSLFEESLKMELENRRAYYQTQDLLSLDFKDALNVFFDYLSDFRKNNYKMLTFYQSLAYAQHSPAVQQALDALWKNTEDILEKILLHARETGVLRQDFSARHYAQILLSYIGGSAIFSFENFDLLKEMFLNLIYHELKPSQN
ncbi:MAG: TetR/AcrR family transcriptional regulator [Lachnospiraceae bacterium]